MISIKSLCIVKEYDIEKKFVSIQSIISLFAVTEISRDVPRM